MLAFTRRLAAARRGTGDDGVSTVEYGFLVAAIVAVVLLVLFAVATLVEKGFDDSCPTDGGASGATSVSCPA